MCSSDLVQGQSVKVPFGPRTLQGIVFAVVDAPQVEETRDIADTLSAGALLESHQLSLARWISEYYLSSLFESAALMLPPGGRFRSEERRVGKECRSRWSPYH